MRGAVKLLRRLVELEFVTRPIHPDTSVALRRRWVELPEHARTPAQTLGQHAVGCVGTHGVFPRCDLTCSPCYHSRDANRVRTDGAHTVAQVDAQLRTLRRLRGPRAHAQLIGGEVSLLPPDDHFAALQAMRAHGREPMSMSHGDFDYDYLHALAVDPQGRPRLARVSFAGHFDMGMFGRRGIERPLDEASLNPSRRRFVEVTGNAVWAQIERGAGTRLPFRALQTGDERCNRTTHGFFVGERYVPILDDECPADLRVRDVFFRHLGGVDFAGTPVPVLVAKLTRLVARHPVIALVFGRWLLRTARRAGLLRLLHHRRIRPVTFVMHSFMDAADVAPAWAAMQRGETATEPRVAAAQQRLRACSYAMAHPETGEVVPACVQHAVLDPAENVALRALLPLPMVRRGA